MQAVIILFLYSYTIKWHANQVNLKEMRQGKEIQGKIVDEAKRVCREMIKRLKIAERTPSRRLSAPRRGERRQRKEETELLSSPSHTSHCGSRPHTALPPISLERIPSAAPLSLSSSLPPLGSRWSGILCKRLVKGFKAAVEVGWASGAARAGPHLTLYPLI